MLIVDYFFLMLGWGLLDYGALGCNPLSPYINPNLLFFIHKINSIQRILIKITSKHILFISLKSLSNENMSTVFFITCLYQINLAALFFFLIIFEFICFILLKIYYLLIKD